ncbi:TPA: molecular chaperone [Escherichia coli]|uniref:fimbrial biogenesis chaperone n=1 Tax=Escherichia coli TaxID=562 RepID=UPI000B50CB75|nr:molecular chaperone [Escherichia coli]MCN5536707.1 molecular chaperone [Escherichia coli]HEI3626670.1 molecular chaperone [Escherichia coli]
MRNLLIFIILYTISKAVLCSSTFGPYEGRLIYHEDDKNISYRIDNTGDFAWLSQAWVEELDDKKSEKFTVVPYLFRVEPNSQYTARIIKKEKIREDRESLFWVVTNSIPGRVKDQDKLKRGDVDAKLNLAFRYKVPMIYRPNTLKHRKFNPEKVKWGSDPKGMLELYNNTEFVIHLQYISLGGKRKEGAGITLLIPPFTNAVIRVKARKGMTFKYGVVNDYGAVREYNGTTD